MADKLEKRMLDALESINAKLNRMQRRIDGVGGLKVPPVGGPGFDIVVFNDNGDGTGTSSDGDKPHHVKSGPGNYIMLIPLDDADYTLTFFDENDNETPPPFKGFDSSTVDLSQIVCAQIQGKGNKDGVYKYTVTTSELRGKPHLKGDGDPEIIVDG
jgi:hypothetical protein